MIPATGRSPVGIDVLPILGGTDASSEGCHLLRRVDSGCCSSWLRGHKQPPKPYPPNNDQNIGSGRQRHVDIIRDKRQHTTYNRVYSWSSRSNNDNQQLGQDIRVRYNMVPVARVRSAARSHSSGWRGDDAQIVALSHERRRRGARLGQARAQSRRRVSRRPGRAVPGRYAVEQIGEGAKTAQALAASA
jgi:hypothetical protein